MKQAFAQLRTLEEWQKLVHIPNFIFLVSTQSPLYDNFGRCQGNGGPTQGDDAKNILC